MRRLVGPVGGCPADIAGCSDGEDDRAFAAKLGDVGRVDLRHIHRKVHVVAAGASHVLGVIPVLEREDSAVHRQGRQVGVAPVLLVQFIGPFQRIRQFPEFFAGLRRARRQRSRRGRPVEVSLAGDGALAANVQRLERIELSRIGNADSPAVLQLHARIGDRRDHLPKIERQALVLIEVWKDGRCSNGLGRILDRRACPDHAR